jgi:O-antigen/teichoic acid export membrane protein
LGPEILSFIFGVQYREHSRTLAILSIGLVSIALSNQNHVLQIASNGRFSLTISLIGLFSLMGMSLVIVPSLAVEGAGIARAVTMTMMAFITAYVSIRKWGREAAALRNLVFVSSLLLGTVCMLNAWSEQTWVVRSGLLGCNIAVLSFAIRTSNGRSYFSLVTKRMQHVLFTRGAGH